MKKIDNLLLKCSSCNVNVIFDLIDDIECDWGSHTVIQCPNCEELFSIDNPCPAFSSMIALLKLNPDLLNSIEKYNYLSKSHPC
ncbi:hypothetical protein [Nitrosarchaeum sp.]|uniref:hypothetical protein n=1 Tax=Nitrosarchaeum sp. TaxID=2026886 RepID=UPI00247E9BAB|nr:hypothetical protein [Nitrosarchaeum sp.]MCV0411606.1 hypothetical protein [Nitrosarchaeum sp.]